MLSDLLCGQLRRIPADLDQRAVILFLLRPASSTREGPVVECKQ